MSVCMFVLGMYVRMHGQVHGCCNLAMCLFILLIFLQIRAKLFLPLSAQASLGGRLVDWDNALYMTLSPSKCLHAVRMQVLGLEVKNETYGCANPAGCPAWLLV